MPVPHGLAGRRGDRTGSWNQIDFKQRGFYALLLALKTGMLGVFVSMDLFLFYCFWELLLIPMYFIVGIWGSGNRLYAAEKFFIYTFSGSLLMLVAIIASVWIIGGGTGTYSFAYDHIWRTRTCWRPSHPGSLPPSRSHSRSRCRSSRSTPGCRTRTARRPRPAVSTWR